MFAANSGCFDKVPLDKVKAADESLRRELKSSHAKLIHELNTGNLPSESQNNTVLKVAKSICSSYEVRVKKEDKEDKIEKEQS